MVFQLHLDTKKVEHIDLPDALCVSPYTSMRNVFEQLKESQRGSVLVCRDGIVAGIFTERDASYLRALNSSIDQSIEKVMNPTLIQGHETIQATIPSCHPAVIDGCPWSMMTPTPVNVQGNRHPSLDSSAFSAIFLQSFTND